MRSDFSLNNIRTDSEIHKFINSEFRNNRLRLEWPQSGGKINKSNVGGIICCHLLCTLSGITPPLYSAFQINHHARTPRHNNYNRYDELGTAQFVRLVLGSDGIHNLLVYCIIQQYYITTLITCIQYNYKWLGLRIETRSERILMY